MASGVLRSDYSYTHNKEILCDISETEKMCLCKMCVLTEIGEHIFIGVAI
jgi:hypothetical protein